MEQNAENTAEHVLHLVRSRMSTEIPLGTAGIQNPSAARIVETFRARFAKACDAGVWKRLSNTVLEPANPFDVKSRRELRQEALILGTLVLVALGLAVYFNVTQLRGEGAWREVKNRFLIESCDDEGTWVRW